MSNKKTEVRTGENNKHIRVYMNEKGLCRSTSGNTISSLFVV